MFEKLKGNMLFHRLLKRHDINQAYKMVGPEDSWYDTITTVHKSLAQMQKLPHEDWSITSCDGLKLKGLYYPCEGSCKTVIWVHGYTSHAERESAFPSLFYRSLGFNVLIPYLRAHGPSQGRYISFGPMERLDIMAWVDMVNERHPDGQILIHGLSMGGGIVLDLATVEMENVKCLLADAPSYSIENVFHYASLDAFKKNSEKVAQYAMARFQKEFVADPCDFDRVANIKDGLYPLLLSAGSNEGMDEVLNQIQQNNPKKTTVLILPGCNHGNGMYKQTEMYQTAIREFIQANMEK
jgi:pimeloyl-ACP methyl ester carboxylesterase